MLLTPRIGKWTYCVSNFRGFRPKHWKLERKKSHSCHTLLDPKHWNACHYTARVRDSVFFITPYNACPTLLRLAASAMTCRTYCMYNFIVTATGAARQGEVNVKICVSIAIPILKNTWHTWTPCTLLDSGRLEWSRPTNAWVLSLHVCLDALRCEETPYIPANTKSYYSDFRIFKSMLWKLDLLNLIQFPYSSWKIFAYATTFPKKTCVE